MDIHLFGHAKSSASRKAQRFFSERRIPVHFHDVRSRAPAPKELRRWVQRFGVDGVIDESSTTYREQGLAYLSADEEGWVDRLVADPSLLTLPLVRCGDELAVGEDPEGWERLAVVAGQD